MLILLVFMAVISQSAESLPKASNRASRKDIGMVTTQKEGSMYAIRRRMSETGTSLEMTSSARLSNLPIKSTRVKTAKPKKNGTAISLKR